MFISSILRLSPNGPILYSGILGIDVFGGNWLSLGTIGMEWTGCLWLKTDGGVGDIGWIEIGCIDIGWNDIGMKGGLRSKGVGGVDSIVTERVADDDESD